jgi:hypothetical protein
MSTFRALRARGARPRGVPAACKCRPLRRSGPAPAVQSDLGADARRGDASFTPIRPALRLRCPPVPAFGQREVLSAHRLHTASASNKRRTP